VLVLEKHPLPWRQGRSVGRTLYDANEVLIGLVDSRELALFIVTAVNSAHLEVFVMADLDTIKPGGAAPSDPSPHRRETPEERVREYRAELERMVRRAAEVPPENRGPSYAPDAARAYADAMDLSAEARAALEDLDQPDLGQAPSNPGTGPVPLFLDDDPEGED
jgi:hypothetical protein